MGNIKTKDEANDIIERFLNGENYLHHDYVKDEHVLGCFFYGSYTTGYATERSDIDLHIVYNNSDPNRFMRCNDEIDGVRIEYFEKPLEDLYASVNNEFISQENATLHILGNSIIMLDKKGELKKLQEYTVKKFSQPLPPLSIEEAREEVSILDNRMDRVIAARENNDKSFTILYYATIEKIRKFYHRLNGFPKIATSKVFKIYSDPEYRASIQKDRVPEQEFIDMYMDAATTNEDDDAKLEKLKSLYNFSKRNVPLNKKYRIIIKSRNK